MSESPDRLCGSQVEESGGVNSAGSKLLVNDNINCVNHQIGCVGHKWKSVVG